MDKEKAYKLFLKELGYTAQATMAIEEMSELTKEVCKLERFKNNKVKSDEIIKKIKEEVANVLNSVEQLKYHFRNDKIEKN